MFSGLNYRPETTLG